MNPTDEQIAAWLDGVLSDQDNAAFEAAMDADPALAERVLRWQDNDAQLKAAIPEEPVSEALLARLGLGNATTVAPVVNLADARAARDQKQAAKSALFARLRWPAMGAIAASVAAALVLLPQLRGDAPEGLEASQAFQIAMQNQAATQPSSLEDGRKATPMLSFKAGDGRYCREYILSDAQASQTGIACRGAESWTVEAQVQSGAGPQDEGQIRTAEGADASALDSAYARLKASDPLAASDEQALIAKNWGQ